MNAEDLNFVVSTCTRYFNPAVYPSSIEQFCLKYGVYLCTELWTYGNHRQAKWKFFGNLNEERRLVNLVHEHYGKLINHPIYAEQPSILHRADQQGTANIFRFAAVCCFQDKITESENLKRIESVSR